MSDLKGKVAIITGGARGIGAACAQAFCERGAAVLITDRLEEAGKQTAASLRARGFQADFVVHDITEESGWKRVTDRALELYGRIDCLVNNAGISIMVTIDDATLAALRQIFEVNTFGAVLGMQAVTPMMKSQGGGSIINISSGVTRSASGVASIYGASKAALAYITKSAATHFAENRYGIRVNSVHPGAIDTEMLHGSVRDSAASGGPSVQEMLSSIVPMRRVGKPIEIGTVVAFLASDDSSYMTGTELFVDGGSSAT